MSGRAAAPWERDDREAQKLDARLHRALLDNKSLQDAVAEKDQQLREHGNDLREALSNLRKQTQLTTEADQKAEKTLDVRCSSAAFAWFISAWLMFLTGST